MQIPSVFTATILDTLLKSVPFINAFAARPGALVIKQYIALLPTRLNHLADLLAVTTLLLLAPTPDPSLDRFADEFLEEFWREEVYEAEDNNCGEPLSFT